MLSELNEVSAEISNEFWEFITKAERTQTRVCFADAVSLNVVISFHTDVENKYSGIVLRLKEKISLTQNTV